MTIIHEKQRKNKTLPNEQGLESALDSDTSNSTYTASPQYINDLANLYILRVF